MEFFIIIMLLGIFAPVLGPILGLAIAAISGLVNLIMSGYRYSNGIPEPEKQPSARAAVWGIEDDSSDGILDDLFDDLDDDDHDGSYYGDICDGTFENSYWD